VFFEHKELGVGSFLKILGWFIPKLGQDACNVSILFSHLKSQALPIASMGLVFLPTCPIKIQQMYVHIPYMDGMG